MGILGIGEKKARKLTGTCGGTDFMLGTTVSYDKFLLRGTK